jgi:hypothetical protein
MSVEPYEFMQRDPISGEWFLPSVRAARLSAQTPPVRAETLAILPDVSAQTPSTNGAERNGLRFVTARELAALTPERPEFAVDHALAFGATTELVGKTVRCLPARTSSRR